MFLIFCMIFQVGKPGNSEIAGIAAGSAAFSLCYLPACLMLEDFSPAQGLLTVFTARGPILHLVLVMCMWEWSCLVLDPRFSWGGKYLIPHLGFALMLLGLVDLCCFWACQDVFRSGLRYCYNLMFVVEQGITGKKIPPSCSWGCQCFCSKSSLGNKQHV